MYKIVKRAGFEGNSTEGQPDQGLSEGRQLEHRVYEMVGNV